MTITVRLYRHSDLDLLLLCGAYGKRFARFASDCLRSFIRNIPPYLAGMPDIEFIEDHESLVSSKYVGVSFSTTEDADILSFLKNNVRYGYRNNFIKNVLRFYAGKACVAAYCSTKEGYNYLKQSGMQASPFAMQQPVNVPTIFPVAAPARPKAQKPRVIADKKPTNVATPAAKPMIVDEVLAPDPVLQKDGGLTSAEIDVFKSFVNIM